MHKIFLITFRLFIPQLLVLSLMLPATIFSQNNHPIADWLNGFRAGADFRAVNLFQQTSARQDLKNVVAHASVLTADDDVVDQLLHQAAPTVLFDIPQKDGSLLSLELARVELCAPDFSVGTKGDQAVDGVPFHQAVHYRGIVKGNPASIAAVSVTSSGITGMVADDSGNYELGQLQDGSGQYIYYKTANLTALSPLSCHGDEVAPSLQDDEGDLADERGIGCKTVSIYFECDYKLFTDKGSSVVNVTNYVTSLFNQIATLYANENVGVSISQIYVWTTPDPYMVHNNTANLLNAFRQTKGTNFNGNLAHFLSTRSLGGGIAYVDVICFKQYAFGVSCINNSFQNVPTYSWSVEVVTHELGHNLGSWHTQSCNWANGPIDNCVSPEGSCAAGPPPVNGGTIMSYCHLTGNGINFNHGFGPQPGAKIRDKVVNATCITSSGTAPSGLSTSNITGASATLTWVPVGGATTYVVQYRLASSSSWTSGGTTTASTMNLNGLSGNSAYQWQVRTDCSGFSATASFTTGSGGGGSGCTAPTNLSTGSITTLSALLAWGQVPAATNYTVQYKTTSSGTWLTAGTTVNTSYNLGSLNSGTTYNWRVKANCSGYSVSMTFSTSSSGGGGITCATPSNLINNYVYANSASISWSPVNGATSYTLQLKLASASTYFTLGTVPVTAVTMSGLQANTSYHWRVKANCSLYSAPKLMTTPPNANGGDNNATFDVPTLDTTLLSVPISIYPNPAKDVVFLKQTGDTDVESEVVVSNAMGRTVLKQTLPATTSPIHVTDLPAGVYFLRVWQGGKCLATEKVVIQK